MDNIETVISNVNELVDDTTVSGKSIVVHFRLQQRNGRKCVTLITGIPDRYDHDKILKHFKKSFSCNGTIQQSKEGGIEYKLSGDQRKSASQFFLNEGIILEEHIKMHGF